MNKLILLLIVGIVFVSGCQTINGTQTGGEIPTTKVEVQTENESIEIPECSSDIDCYGGLSRYGKNICLNNKCEQVECVESFDCISGLMSSIVLGLDYYDCIDYTCIDFKDECKEIAKSDYDMSSPQCMYKGDMRCWCKGKVVDEAEYEVEKENSIQTVPEVYHYTDMIIFNIK